MGRKPSRTAEVAEVDSLARTLARNYERTVEHFRRINGKTFEEADALASDSLALKSPEDVLSRDPKDLTWSDLDSLVGARQSLRAWRGVREMAQEEEAQGLASSLVVESYRSIPWERAQFLALRKAVIDECRPRGGLELTLIDTYVSALYMYRFWLKQLADHATTQAAVKESDLKRLGQWKAPFEVEARAMSQDVEMVDRFHRMAMRTLRALRDLRRLSPSVSIREAEQVNIAEQQVNVNRFEGSASQGWPRSRKTGAPWMQWAAG